MYSITIESKLSIAKKAPQAEHETATCLCTEKQTIRSREACEGREERWARGRRSTRS